MKVKVSWIEEWERTEVVDLDGDDYREWIEGEGQSPENLRAYIKEIDIADWHPRGMPSESDCFYDLTVTEAVEEQS